jgi:hypothetical protein
MQVLEVQALEPVPRWCGRDYVLAGLPMVEK